MSDLLSMVDLTGTNPEFLRVDKTFMVFQANQTIDFEEPAFVNSNLKLYKWNGSSWDLLVSGTDYLITTALRDITAISKAKTLDPDFDSNLVTGVVINDGIVAAQYQVKAQYQGFYKAPAQYSGEGDGPDYTPALMKSVLEKVHFLEQYQYPIIDVVAESIANVRAMEIDLAGTNSDNLVTEEEHSVNVPSNIYVIRPINGSFYLSDLVVKNGATTLTRGVDYEVRGLNRGKTRVSSNTSGVYEYITLNASIVGTVKVTYRAFGGEITQNDLDLLKEGLLSIWSTVNNTNFLTPTTLPLTPLMISVLSRLTLLEEAVQHYVMQYFQYTYTKFTYNSNTYTKDKWVDVASIAHGPWSESASVPTSYTGSFKLVVDANDYSCDFDVKYDLASNSLSTQIHSIKASSYEIDEEEYFTKRIVPKFRIVWNSASVDSGIILQMAITSPVSEQVPIRFFNKSGVGTVWSLVDSAGSERTDAAATTTLPDESTWTKDAANMEVSNEQKLLSDHVVFAGNIPVTAIEALSYSESEGVITEGSGMTIPVTLNNLDISVSDIKGIKLTMYDRFTNKLIVESSNQVQIGSTSASSLLMYFPTDLCNLEFHLTRTDSTVTSTEGPSETLTAYAAVVKTRSGTNSLNNSRFDLRQISILL